jgi:hypothetical protein
MPIYPLPDPATIAEFNRAQALEAKKAAMKQKLEKAIANGEMPPFCSNCGAIETPTWRKAWSQDVTGPPPYYEYSDKPGKVTMVLITGRDEQGNPTSYQLIKKFLLPEEEQADYSEVILCNRKFQKSGRTGTFLIILACGIWMSKYKSHRPEERWECNRKKKAPEKKRGVQRPAKPRKAKGTGNFDATSEANYPQSDYPQSEAYNQQSEVVGQAEDSTQMRQTEFARPTKRLHPMTSDAAPAALRRALKSSPARWTGVADSPIDVEEEDLGNTRRLLFPSPRKDGSPKVLGELVTNVVTIATDFQSPKEAAMEISNKENCPPMLDAVDSDANVLTLFEEEMARPKTPKKSSSQNAFQTPTRPTPSHRPITRSVTRSIRSLKSPGQLLLFQKTPSKTPSSGGRRRSPRDHLTHHFESPFTATLNQIISDANENHSPSRGMQLDFSNLPDLTDMDNTRHENFGLEDFFPTDAATSSSPTRTNFHLYEDPLAMCNMNWDDFSGFDASMLENSIEDANGSKDTEVKKEPGTMEETEESTHPDESLRDQASA